jgi:protein-disulfide isomerase
VPNKTARIPGRSLANTFLPPWSRPLAVALAGALVGACAPAHPDDGIEEAPDAVDAAPIPPPSQPESGALAGIPQQGNVLGSATAPVTLMEFSDLRCSHCRAFVDDSLQVLIDRYVRTGQLRIVFQNLPILGQASVDAARMAAAVGLQGHEFEFVAAFFHRDPGPVTDAALRHVAAQIPGLNVEAAMELRGSPTVDAALADARRLAIKFAIGGTPSFLLGRTGEALHDLASARANKPETLTQPIDALLAHR